MSELGPAADTDLFWHRRLNRELAEQESRHQAEAERLVGALLGALSDLNGLLALRHGDAARYRRGTELVIRKLGGALREAGAELIGAPGEPFDPAVHKVIGVAESPGVPPDHVTQVLRPGCRYRGRVTPADVMVSAVKDEGPAAGDPGSSPLDTDEEQA